MKNPILIGLMGAVLLFSCQKKEEQTSEVQKSASQPVQQTKPAPQTESVSDIGIGPVKKVNIDPNVIDKEMAKRGEEIFKMKCSMCHKLDEKYVGPPLKGVSLAMKPEWIMNMILNPIEMTQKDPVAKALYETYLTQMTPQNLSEQEAREVLEYLRSVDKESK